MPVAPKQREGGRTWPALEISRLDDLVQAALTDHDVAAIDEDLSRVFFHTADARDEALASLQRSFSHLSISPVDVPDEDWAARSQASLKAIRIGNIVVAPPWDVGAPNPGSPEGPRHTASAPGSSPSGSTVAQGFSPANTITIVVEPSMGFGTGHHATTRLCLAHLQEIDLRNRTVLDVGTGSGVLAMAASRLGASHVLGVDDDPDAIESAKKNIALNPGADLTLGVADIRRTTVRPFDVVVANLTGGLLTAIAPVLEHVTGRGGRLVLSGFMESEEPGVLKAFVSCTIDRRSQEDEWVCVSLLRSR